MGSTNGASLGSPLTPGYRLDRYELLGPLAEGGMASVWIARQRGKHGFEKLVALKTILPQYASDLRFQQMFLDEARIASRIEHFNVARIIDLGEEHDVLYLAMEYVDGDALSKLRRASEKKGQKIPPGIVLRVLADACSGLHEAHELRDADGKTLGVVHRDISPHNILVSTKGVTKLIDFGIAKARDRIAGETNAGVLKGKIQYMAPEQALGRPVDRRADIWAVGASLYHLLSGRPPYDAENTLGTLHLLTSGRPPLPLPANVHPAIAAIARKALTTPPDRRFATAAEMRDAIENAMIDARVATTTAEVAAYATEYLAERTAKRRQTIDIAIAAAAERERVEELLKPVADRTGTGLTSAPGVTIAEGTATKTREDAAGLSSATIPSGDVHVAPPSLSDIPMRRSRTPLVLGLVIVAALAVAGGVAFATLGTHAEPARKPVIFATVTATATATATVTATATATMTATATATVIPVMAASALPHATAAATAPAPGRATPPVATHPPKKKTVDDGF
ncbi:MAG TPA: serine/threonine-protein kinase [Polyangiaceae bacterium]